LNSLGGHIALYHTKCILKKVAGLVMELRAIAAWAIAKKRGDYEYIKKEAEDVFTTLQLLN
jgi:hypothetical protein